MLLLRDGEWAKRETQFNYIYAISTKHNFPTSTSILNIWEGHTCVCVQTNKDYLDLMRKNVSGILFAIVYTGFKWNVCCII